MNAFSPCLGARLKAPLLRKTCIKQAKVLATLYLICAQEAHVLQSVPATPETPVWFRVPASGLVQLSGGNI